MFVGSNGLLTFGAGTASISNQDLPSPEAPNGLIAMLWDDLDPSAGGTVHIQDMEDGRVIVQFTDVPRYAQSQGQSFQAVLLEDGTIELFYLGTDGSATYSIGTESADGSQGVGVAYEEPYLSDAFAVRIEQAGPAWVRVESPSLAVSPGTTAAATLRFDTAELAVGTYSETLAISTNDPTLLEVEIPVTLTVTQRVSTQNDAAQPAALALALPYPNPSRGYAHVAFSLAEAGAVRLSVMDALGRHVATLAEGELPAGPHTRTLDTSGLAAGTYLIQLEADAQVLTQRATVLR